MIYAVFVTLIYMPELLFTKRIKRSADLMIVMKLNIET